MFDQPGIGLDDLPQIHREQFLHYVQLAHALGDPHDWPRLREHLLQALTAAFGLDVCIGHGDGDQLTARQRRVVELLDEIRHHHDPTTDWADFVDTLWRRRHAIRPDLT